MGKQINYWMDYESFCELATMAVDLGCIIVKIDKDTRKVIQSKEISIVTRDCFDYYFYIPDAGELKIGNNEFGEYIDRGYSETQNAIIEASYSRISDEEKKICRKRLYSITGYYKDEEFVSRPACVEEIYKKLVKKVKKLAPYTELVDIHKENGTEYIHKEYLTPQCLRLRNKEEYSLVSFMNANSPYVVKC